MGLGDDDSSLTLEVLDEETIEGDWGWIFFYATADPTGFLVGGAPFLVSRETGKLHDTGSAKPIEEYLQNFLETGDPHRKGK